MNRVNPRISAAFLAALRRRGVRATHDVLTVHIRSQTMHWWTQVTSRLQAGRAAPRAERRALRAGALVRKSSNYRLHKSMRISTSAYGIGQVMHSNQTPLGLHCIAAKIGAGALIGTVFRSRRPVGYTWQGMAEGTIVHRILWLAGLEPGFNQGGDVDTYRRYIYIHGFSDESTLGRPNSHGCIHVAAKDLVPLFQAVPPGTLVWIET